MFINALAKRTTSGRSLPHRLKIRPFSRAYCLQNIDLTVDCLPLRGFSGFQDRLRERGVDVHRMGNFFRR